jgi:hypothetical protein
MILESVAHLGADPQEWVKAGQRILRHQGDALAANRA